MGPEQHASLLLRRRQHDHVSRNLVDNALGRRAEHAAAGRPRGAAYNHDAGTDLLGDLRDPLVGRAFDCVDAVPRLLRPGFITLSQLRSVVPDVVAGSDAPAPRAPGSDAKHYAPATPLSIVNSRTLEEVVAQLTADHEKVAVLAMRPPRLANRYMTWINAGRRADVYARELYVNLRTLDKSGAKEILVEEVPPGESWDAVRDRLRRAASVENLVTVDPDIAALRADFGEDIGLP